MIDASAIVPWLLLTALKASIILAAAFVITALLRGASAATRHAVWLAAFVGVLALPVAGAVLPALRVVMPEPIARWLPGSPAPAIVDEVVVVPVPARKTIAGEPAVVVVTPHAAHAPSGGVAGGAPVAALAPRIKVRPNQWYAVAADAWPVEAASPSAWPMRVFLVWVFGFIMVAVAFAVGVLRAHVVACTALPARGDALSDEVEVLSASLGIVRDVRAMTWPGPAMPMTWGALRPVVLLPEEARQWPAARRREVLLHELAHVRRGDWAARLVAALACAIHWFNPLAWMAAARMRDEQELACDDTVLAGGVEPSDYAAHLLEVARALRVPRFAMANASVAMARPSQLTGRLLAVLDETRVRAVSAPRRTVALCAVLGLALVATVGAAMPSGAASGAYGEPWVEVGWPEPAVPPADAWAPPVPPVPSMVDVVVPVMGDAACWETMSGDEVRAGAGHGAGHGTSVSQSRGRGRSGVSRSHSSSTHDDGTNELTTLSLSHGSCRLELRMSGRVRFNDAETDVIEVASGASFRLSEDADGVERQLDVSWRGGQLVRRWRVDGDDVAETEELRRWLARTLQVALTQTGYNVVPRTMRAYRAGGLDSALTLAHAMGSDYAKRQTLMVLLDSARVSQSDAARIAREALTMSSDYEKAELLIAVARTRQLDGAVQDAMIEASSSMSSDYERRRVLSAALARRELSPQAAQQLLRSAATMSSDYEKAELLIEFGRGRGMNADQQAGYLAATSSMSSDYEHRRVLADLVARPDASPAIAEPVCAQSQRLSSDYERAELLVQLARKFGSSADARACIRRSTDAMTSDYEKDRVLAVLGRMSQ